MSIVMLTAATSTKRLWLQVCLPGLFASDYQMALANGSMPAAALHQIELYVHVDICAYSKPVLYIGGCP